MTRTALQARPATTRPLAFAAVTFLFAVTMVGTTVTTPLYANWERDFGFGPITTTCVFAIYAVGVMAALVLSGRSSDVDGRRPVLAVAAALSAVAASLFIVADGTAVLFVARLVSGLSAGLATAAGTAALVDLAGPDRRVLRTVVPGMVNFFGLGAGPLLGGIVAQGSSDPTNRPFELDLVLLAVAVVVGMIPADPVTRQGPFVTVERPRVALPEDGRATFVAAAVGGFVIFALIGLFTSLVPTFLGQTLHQHNPAVVGATVALVFGVSVVTQLGLALARVPSGRAVEIGLVLLVVALGLIVASLDVASYPLFLVGTGVAGLAVGAAFSGALATVLSVAADHERGQVSSAFYLIAYVGLTIPVIVVGIGIAEAGIVPTVTIAAAALGALGVGALVFLRRRPAPTG